MDVIGYPLCGVHCGEARLNKDDSPRKRVPRHGVANEKAEDLEIGGGAVDSRNNLGDIGSCIAEIQMEACSF
jgi:hypothetical protein